ncbi:serine hydrolase domain-containing protein [Hyunsoonleella pacifica]|uniref:Class C beta-lactamase-related serine hydrolase n=1 Tax=Hyunsoonleella pacifica TaxID=1080224 RepID=A0A4Q9FLV0_9FLAO|nr:serine hydrolase [Hyunsoonleella pacifica]TBN13828.1 class C beta-lactamase-related serine hydrolase [Hyunsoonleella pacifica]GGD26033.1 serine hydrolase [Hyunsoonleella pacifica]
MKINIFYLLITIFSLCSCSSEDTNSDTPEIINDSIYFPPLSSDVWENKAIETLGWNQSELQPLLNFLEEKDTKSFMILHEGKIVVEAYMNGHDITKPWYWASAGKTLTTAVSGIAQEEGIINIGNKVSDYLGKGWTSTALEKENLITCKHLLSMNSGLDDSLGDNVSKENLQYKADAGTRWAYHNVYKKMQDVVSAASNTSWNSYFESKLKSRIGINGAWIQSSGFNVYWSNTRSMARFGLMIYAKGKWNNTQIVPKTFLEDATNTSQDINLSYGYLWWLNGKNSYHLPASQLKFNGSLIPNAPMDTYAALGKNDQKIYVVPSKKLVIIRMGNKANSGTLALSSFDNELWRKINALIN